MPVTPSPRGHSGLTAGEWGAVAHIISTDRSLAEGFPVRLCKLQSPSERKEVYGEHMGGVQAQILTSPSPPPSLVHVWIRNRCVLRDV